MIGSSWQLGKREGKHLEAGPGGTCERFAYTLRLWTFRG